MKVVFNLEIRVENEVWNSHLIVEPNCKKHIQTLRENLVNFKDGTRRLGKVVLVMKLGFIDKELFYRSKGQSVLFAPVKYKQSEIFHHENPRPHVSMSLIKYLEIQK